ncbi:hypothetical protein NKJ04_17600 [Mesorhizobium sp. M0618]|uniref:hypothetical protein n=1 Tax=Mesorhizobium sp. M0618 TaxID=2956972 RepID=UPI00333C5B80
MLIPVLGMDPSLRHWGLAEGNLDLTAGVLSTPIGSIIEPKDLEGKQVRVNSNDLWLAEQLSTPVFLAVKKAKIIFVECPVGSQSARTMAAYGVQMGILGMIRAMGIPLIEVTATENKKVFTGKRTATKREMIDQLIVYYPEIILPPGKGGKPGDKSEHIADAVASIHSGVRTPMFQNLLRLFNEV